MELNAASWHSHYEKRVCYHGNLDWLNVRSGDVVQAFSKDHKRASTVCHEILSLFVFRKPHVFVFV